MNANHWLYRLSESIDWVYLEKEINGLLGQKHQPYWRLVSGSIYLKAFYDVSTADLIAFWPQCPHYRFFCTGREAEESCKDFPIPPETLDLLSLSLAGKGYDAMIKALTVNNEVEEHKPIAATTLH